MKSLIIALLMVTAGAGLGRAELFSPSVVPGAVIGGVAGAVIAHNSGYRGPEGALVGALTGGLIGAAIDQDHSGARYYSHPREVSYETRTVYTDCSPRVIYAPAPVRRVTYIEPRREVIVRRDDRRDDRARYDRDHRRDDRHYDYGRR